MTPRTSISPSRPRSADRLDRDRQAAPQVFERLRDLIISLELPPGSPLSRIILAKQFGVSSTPIRDALMRLDEEGLVEVYPQHATVVSRIDTERAQQAHFLRQSLELEIVRTLALDHSNHPQEPEISPDSWRPTTISISSSMPVPAKADFGSW
jgi:DNA-binding GntR family transcriptional regulator